MPQSKSINHLYLIDGSGFIFRAYYGIKAQMTRLDGTPTNAVYGYTQMLLKIVEDTDADYLAVIFDRARKTFRNEIFSEYKSHRPPPPDDLIPQFDIIREATHAMNIPAVDMDGYEADDLIATYARQAADRGANVTVVSTDKDLMQIVGGKIKMFDAMKNIEIGPSQVREKFGVGPEKVIDVQALAGDASDNVPGVAGIGIKTAAQLIEEFGDLDGVLKHAEDIKQPKRRQALIEQADIARISRELVTLRQDVPVEVELESFARKKQDPGKLLTFLNRQNFKSIVSKIESKTGVKAPEMVPNPDPDDKSSKATSDGPNSKINSLDNVTPITRASYELITEENILKIWIDEATALGRLAVDTETTSLDSMAADLVGISLSTTTGRAAYIPLGHTEPSTQTSLRLDPGGQERKSKYSELKQIPFDKAIKFLKPLLENPSVLKIGHNIKYDIEVLYRYGIDLSPFDDTMILSYVLEGAQHRHGMDELSQIHLNHQTIKFKDVAGTGKTQVTFDKVPLDDALQYAAEDADITGRLHNQLKPRLIKEKMSALYEAMERPLIGVLANMEKTGILVNAKFLKDLSKDFAKRLADLEIEIHKMAGKEFNIASPKQLGTVLFDEMGLPGGIKGKTGAYGTGADILENLSHAGHDRRVVIEDADRLGQTSAKEELVVAAQNRVLGPNQVPSLVESLRPPKPRRSWPVNVVKLRSGVDRFLNAHWYRI